jgi:hypothetical protein
MVRMAILPVLKNCTLRNRAVLPNSYGRRKPLAEHSHCEFWETCESIFETGSGSTDNSDLRQCILKRAHSGVSNLGPLDFQFDELGQSLQLVQP